MTGRQRDHTKGLLSLIDAIPGLRIAVIGDLIADEFLYGRIERVSREAPVLVLQYRDLVRLPGGAANAANNLLELACRTAIIGTVGRDDAGDSLAHTLARRGADLRHLRRSASCSTPVKTRILAGAHHSTPQQVVRVDKVTEPQPVASTRWERLRPTLSRLDGVILSDYGYGSADPRVVHALRRNLLPNHVPVVVDSRFRMNEFSGVTSITPNITELEQATGQSIGSDSNLLTRTAKTVLHRQKLEHLLVTQGRFGMTLFERGADPLHIPIFGSDEVADVTGAGDTVSAVFTAALARGASPADAARLANYAGGIVVMKRGTATVTIDELRRAVTSDAPR